MAQEKGKTNVEVNKDDTDVNVNKDTNKTYNKKSKTKKSYIHIDTFLATASQTYDLSRMQIQGFKIFMDGQQYQKDEQVFEDNLKKYLNIN